MKDMKIIKKNQIKLLPTVRYAHSRRRVRKGGQGKFFVFSLRPPRLCGEIMSFLSFVICFAFSVTSVCW